VKYPSPEIRTVLERTLGVPLFQEQAMKMAIVAAGFSPGEADQLRRAMAAWKRKGDLIVRFGEKIVTGMLANGYTHAYALTVFEQIKGFGEYGFPESHAASFALIVYASPITAFVRERCSVGAGHRTEVDELYRRWLVWCTEQGRDHPGTKPSFGRDLAAAFPAIKVTQPRIAGVQIRHYEGIAIGVEYQGEERC
jgi:hypothetical protein